MFVIDRNKELVGHSLWPWDRLYAPVVGCFEDGLLVAVATCRHEPQRVRLSGPMHRAWFRMRIPGSTRAAIEEGDPSVVLLRLEDGASVRFADRAVEDVPIHQVEDMVTRVSTLRRGPLDGFPRFVAAPHLHQLDVMFLDYLKRLPDPEARDNYLVQIDRGMSIFQIREDILASDEFWQRRLTVSDPAGSLITSPLWKILSHAEPLDAPRPPLQTIRVSDYADLSDQDFVRAAHRDCHGDDPSEGGVVGLADVVAREGRGFVASLLVRDAANGGVFYNFVED